MDLRVSAFLLGKVWFNLLESSSSGSSNSGDNEVVLQSPDGTKNSVASKAIQYRLVPDTRNLLGARMLLIMTPEDGEKMKANGGMTPEMAQEAI